ncbi:hypothetical protein C1I98_01010 [Spongiactinospora gelatinilytica]|uniref:Uncharacterized protein n=1 Tax=Spongiactinospora gelatinilytica TaxID=2666298 RepID=A0A2W2HYW2_9ACTN|nr:hypothetical protein C1I98_01010 [Spongiactinospora gelatinilytica]
MTYLKIAIYGPGHDHIPIPRRRHRRKPVRPGRRPRRPELGPAPTDPGSRGRAGRLLAAPLRQPHRLLARPIQRDARPGLPSATHHYPHRDEVAAYLRRYAATLDTEIRTGTRVQAVRVRHGPADRARPRRPGPGRPVTGRRLRHA